MSTASSVRPDVRACAIIMLMVGDPVAAPAWWFKVIRSPRSRKRKRSTNPFMQYHECAARGGPIPLFALQAYSSTVLILYAFSGFIILTAFGSIRFATIGDETGEGSETQPDNYIEAAGVKNPR